MSGMPRTHCPACGAVLIQEDAQCPACLLRAGSRSGTELPEERIFQQALALEPGARDAFICEATQNNPPLLAAVQMLLAGYQEAGGDAALPTQGELSNARAQWAVGESEGPGTVIGHFRLVRLLGEGGMGTVWRAEQMSPVQRMVALKVIKLGMDTREVVRRFERERQTLALLQHPHIAQVFEAGATALGRPYFAMELVEGQPITSYCESAGLNLNARLRLFREVCAAIEHAHQKGVIHRDLKPSNILVAKGTVKVIDFGVAKATQGAGEGEFTRHTQVIGTPAYMSPEQAQSAGADIDTRTDVYALGVVLYELLTGTLPIDSARLANLSISEIQRILREEHPPTPSTRLTLQAGPGNRSCPKEPHPIVLSEELDRVVMKALRKEREERYASAAALSTDLGWYLVGEPVSAMPPTLVYHAGKFVKRHRVAVISSAVVLLALTVATVISTTLAIQARRAARNEQAARKETQKTLGKMYTQRALDNGHQGRASLAAFFAAKVAGISKDDPAEYDASMKRAALWTEQIPAPVRAFQSALDEVRKMTFHPHERYLLAEEREGGREIWDFEREEKWSLDGVDVFGAAAWNADGTLLALVKKEANEITLYPFPSRTAVQAPLRDSGNDAAIACVAFNCTGNLLAAAAGKSVAVFGRAGDGQFGFLFSIPHTNVVRQLAFSPTDPHSLTTAATNASANLFSLDPHLRTYATRFLGERHQLAARRIDVETPPRFDQNGTNLTLTVFRGPSDYGRATYNLATGVAVGPFQPLSGFILAQSPDARTLVLRQESERKVETAVVARAETGQELARVTFNRMVTVANFSPDGQRVIVAGEDGQVVVLAAPDWQRETQLTQHEARVMGVAFSPDGNLVATAQAGGLVRIWRARPAPRSVVALGHDSRVVLSAKGDFFALAGRSSREATLPFSQVYRTGDGQPAGPVMAMTNDLVMDAAFSPVADVLAIATTGLAISRDTYGTNAGAITFWNWRTGARVGEAMRTPSEPRSIAWRPDGGQLAVGCAAGQYLAIDPVSRKLMELSQQEIRWPAQNLVNNGELAYDPSGRLLVAWGLQRAFHVWSCADGEVLGHRAELLDTQCADVSFGPDGILARVETGKRNEEPRLFVEHAVTGELLTPALAQTEWMNSVEFDASGNHLLTTSRDGLARIWDWRQRRLAGPPIKHQGSVHTARFVPGTPYVVTGADRGRFTVADSRTGVELASLAIGSDDSRILEIKLTPDGRMAIMGGSGLDGVGLVRLDALHDLAPIGLEGTLQVATLNAAVTMDPEGTLTPLTAEEWLRLWQQFRREYPGYHRL